MSQKTGSERQPAPRATRPHMPGYGIAAAEAGQGLLPWDWAVERLSKGYTYWLCTTRPDGRPHAMPIWGIWLDDAFLFSTGRQSRKARNLQANPCCVVGVEVESDSVVVEGTAEEVEDQQLLQKFAKNYQAKYEWDMEGFEEPVFAVRPSVVFGLTLDLVENATRWTFDQV
jgi:nitroimidazol reductase NimA-like FMN-containing flavoprotein (pyridoxamine 5'-phosphate oxidase superfamily)